MTSVTPLLTAEIGSARLEVCVADITTLAVDAIVNAANRSALDLAGAHCLTSIAFPAISTGIYRFPLDRAARTAVGVVAAEVAAAQRGIARVVFCCFAPSAADHYVTAFAELGLA